MNYKELAPYSEADVKATLEVFHFWNEHNRQLQRERHMKNVLIAVGALILGQLLAAIVLFWFFS